jgi:hypothetical protein
MLTEEGANTKFFNVGPQSRTGRYGAGKRTPKLNQQEPVVPNNLCSSLQ